MKKQKNNLMYNPNDKPNVYFNLLGFVIPLAGFVIFFWEWNSKPIMAKRVFDYSAISLLMGMVYYGIKTFL